MNHISLPASVIFEIGGFGITNAMLSSFLMTFIFLVVALLARRNYKLIPSRFQVAMEAMIEYIFGNLVSAFGTEEKAKKYFPMLMSLFLFILVMNQFSVLPIIFNIMAGEHALFRLTTSDLSLTFAFSLMVVILSHVIAFKIAPINHLNFFIRFIPFVKVRSLSDLGKAFGELIFSLLDLISEIAKVLSLSFRLFGNIFAGEVMVAVIAGLSIYTSFFVPVPFMIISMFSGVIQAIVFVFLASQFISGIVNAYDGQEDKKLAAA